MNTFFGVFSAQAALPAEAALEHLRPMAAAARAERDPGHAGLEVLEARAPRLIQGACNTGRAAASDSPFAQAEGVHLCFCGRLGHRMDLHQSLRDVGRTALDAATPSDAELVLAAYLQFGIDCVQRLEGDWSFALWDSHRSRLLLARDATGFSELYWSTVSGHLCYSNSLKVLLANPAVRARPCPEWFAGLLSVFSDPARPAATAFQDIFAVPPGHLLVRSREENRLQRWWQPEQRGKRYDAPLDQLREEFLAMYHASVSDVLPKSGQRIAATLSGGLDSGSVVALAAPLLARRGLRLPAYVHVPQFDAQAEFPARTPDEWDMAQATARHVGNIDAHACNSAPITPVDGIRQWLQVTVTPSHAALNWYWLLDIVRTAAEHGATALLLGQAGNSTVSYTGNGDLWPRLRRLQWGLVARELRGDVTGQLSALRDRIVKPVLRAPYHALMMRRRTPGDTQPWSSYSLVHPDLARQTGLLDAMRREGHDPSGRRTSRTRIEQFRLTLLGGNLNGSAAWSALGRSCGIQVCDPTRDRRLVEFCWRLPDELFWARGAQRGLVRDVMKSLLPSEVLQCRSKGRQSADLRLRLRASREELRAAAHHACDHPLVREWVDVPRLLRAVEHLVAEDGGEGNADELHSAQGAQHVMRALAGAVFLSQRG